MDKYILINGVSKTYSNNFKALDHIDLSIKEGEIMLKGQYISTGSCTKAVKIEKQQNIKANFGSLGTIEFNYI